MTNIVPEGEKPQAKYGLVEGRWIGVIYYQPYFGDKIVITVGEEKNRKAIKIWINNYLKNECWKNNDEATRSPDMWDRAKLVFN